MNTKTMIGLRADHLPSALSSFAMYEVFPDATLKFVKRHGSYSPVICTDLVKDEDKFLKKFLDRKTWEKLLGPLLHLDVMGDATVKKTQISPKQYKEMLSSDERVATCTATDQKKVNKEGGLYKNPLWCMDRQAKVCPILKELIDTVCGQTVDDMRQVFFGEHYALPLTKASDIGYFHENENDTVNRPNGPSSYEFVGVPILGLLSIVSWRLFPCMCDNRDTTISGWTHNRTGKFFSYPVFSRPHNRNEFLSLITENLFSKFSGLKKGYNSFGIVAAYSSEWKIGSKGGRFFLSPVSL